VGRRLYIQTVLRHFCFNAPCQFTTLLNLHSFVLGLTPFGWLLSVSLYWWECHLGCWSFLIYPLPHFSGTQLGHKSKAGCTYSPLSWFSSVQFSCRGSPLTNPRSFRSPFHFVSCDLFIQFDTIFPVTLT